MILSLFFKKAVQKYNNFKNREINKVKKCLRKCYYFDILIVISVNFFNKMLYGNNICCFFALFEIIF